MTLPGTHRRQSHQIGKREAQLRNEEIGDRNGGLAPTEGPCADADCAANLAAYSARVAKSSEPCFIKCYGDINRVRARVGI
jgi:hypothetical protein